MRWLSAAVVLLWSAPVAAQPFTFDPPGQLVAGSGTGRADDTIYAPTMLFPMQTLPAFANSQVYGNGGGQGPGGGQCDAVNYSYPWQDNYCESRSWDMPLCPSGTGHQGQDIRPATCDKDVHPVVAAENGTITNVGSYSVYLTADDGTRFDYLHMSNVQVSVGQDVQRGDVLGMVSNEFGGTPTTIHLHFNIRQNVAGVGTVYVPTYMSLINSYQRLLDRPIDGAFEALGCDAMVGWAFDPDDREAAVDVSIIFDQAGVAYDVTADVYRGDLCENLGFCDHGFDVPPPYSLFDGLPHEADVTGSGASLPGSPLAMECQAPSLDGAKRSIAESAYTAWQLTAFWDEPPVASEDVDDVAGGSAFPDAPELWRVGDDFYVVDDGVLRPITEAAMRAWRLAADAAEEHDEGELEIATAWPARPLVVRGGSGDVYVIDGEPTSTSSTGSGTGSGGAAADDPTDDDISGGCGCEAPGRRLPASPWLLLLGLPLLRRRRR